jgi:predicted Zn-dependent protease with MMP-like domain
VEDLREEALETLEHDVARALELATEALRRQPDAESHYVMGVAQSADGQNEAAIQSFSAAVKADPDHADAWIALGWEEFDLLDMEEARAAASSALRIDPHHPDALILRAALRERRGDFAGADRDLQAAALTAPDTCVVPPQLEDATIEAIADEVVRSMGPDIQKALLDVHIRVEEVPSDELLASFDPPMRPTELLGCMSGPSIVERSVSDAWSALPASILLFRRNLMRVAHDPEELREELRVTLLHEIGHYLGLDEQDLEDRGLD